MLRVIDPVTLSVLPRTNSEMTYLQWHGHGHLLFPTQFDPIKKPRPHHPSTYTHLLLIILDSNERISIVTGVGSESEWVGSSTDEYKFINSAVGICRSWFTPPSSISITVEVFFFWCFCMWDLLLFLLVSTPFLPFYFPFLARRARKNIHKKTKHPS